MGVVIEICIKYPGGLSSMAVAIFIWFCVRILLGFISVLYDISGL